MTRQSCAKKKVPISQMNISLLAEFWCFLEEKKRNFGPFSAIRQNVKTTVFLQFQPGPNPLSMLVIFGGPDGPTKLGVAFKGQPCNRVNTKMLPIGCPVTIVTKYLEHFRKNEFWAKKLHSRPKILHFYATHIKPPFFGPDSLGP